MPHPLFKAAQILAAVLLIAASMNTVFAQELDATLESSRWDGLLIKYPEALFTVFRPQDDPRKDPEIASMADQDVLKSKDGTAEVYLGGDYNSGFGDAKAYLNMILAGEKETHPSIAVTYRAGRDDWAVASGTFDNKIFYIKVRANCENGAARCDDPETFARAEFNYAAEKRDLYDKLVVEMSQTLTQAIPPD